MQSDQQFQILVQSLLSQYLDKTIEQTRNYDDISQIAYDLPSQLSKTLFPAVLTPVTFAENFNGSVQALWSQLALIAAVRGTYTASLNHRIEGVIALGRLKRISSVVHQLTQETEENTLSNLIAYIQRGKGALLPVSVKCDIYALDVQQNRRYGFIFSKSSHIKGQIDRGCLESLLKLEIMTPRQIDSVYLVVSDTNHLTPPLLRLANEDNSAIMTVQQFWDRIGGTSTYKLIISALQKVHTDYQARIYNEILGGQSPAA